MLREDFNEKLLIGTSLLFSVSALAACGGSQSPDDADSTTTTETVPQDGSKAPGAVQDSEKASHPTEPAMAGPQHSDMEDAESKPAAKSAPAVVAKPAKLKAVPSTKPALVVPKEKAPTAPEADPHVGHDMKDMRGDAASGIIGGTT